MSSKELTDAFARSLTGLGFVEIISAEFDEMNVQFMCRVGKGAERKWARIVKSILVTCEAADDYPPHICRLYFLKEGRLVYGWHINITSDDMLRTLQGLDSALQKFTPRPVDLVRTEGMKKLMKSERKFHHPPVPPPFPGKKGVQLRQLLKGQVRLPRRVLEADAKGNPIVPEAHKVSGMVMAGGDYVYSPPLQADAKGNPKAPHVKQIEEIAMAGLPADYDRNAPNDENKGAFGVESDKMKTFRPPVGGGRVGVSNE
jgi:hypothetical protein